MVWKTFFTMLFNLFVFLFGAVLALGDTLVGLTHGTDRHRPEFGFEPSDAYHGHGARNEWEPFQVLLWDDQGLTNVDVTVSEFTGPGDPITTVELYRVHYIPVPVDQISHDPPDPARAGLWPDGLVPFVDHIVGEPRDGAPFDLPATFAQAVFVDVYIPAGQAPGDYEAGVTVTANGMPDWNGTLSLTVWDFDLPNSLSIDSNYQFHRSGACNWHASHGGITDCDTLVARYLEEFARHRMAMYGWRMSLPDYSWNDGLWTFDWDWASFDADHGAYLDGTFYKAGYEFTGMRLPGAPGGRPAHVPAADWEREWWAGWADHFRNAGWLHKLWYYLPDEPTFNEYPKLVEIAARVHNADPDLRVVVTEQFEEELAGSIDTWCPDEPYFSDSIPGLAHPQDYAQRQALGEKVWWYNCVSANLGFDYANHFVDQESTYMRIWLWLTRRYGFEGILYWQTLALTRSGQDVWDSQFYPSLNVQGDGSLIYPGTIDRIGGVTDIPVASLRMKYLREAMEDYEYFHLLDQAQEKSWVDDVTRTVAPKSYQWEHDWAVLLDWRRKVGQKIVGVLDETPPDPPTDVMAQPDVESVRLFWTAPDDTDLEGFDVWYGLYDADAFFGGSVDAQTTHATLGGLTADRDYRIWIRAFDENGNRSDPSEVVTATPQGESETEANSVTTGLESKPNPNDSNDREPFACGGW